MSESNERDALEPKAREHLAIFNKKAYGSN